MASTTTLDSADLTLSARRRRKEGIYRWSLFGTAAFSVVVSVGIVLVLVFEAGAFLAKTDPGQLFADGWFPRRGQFSIPTIFVGSVIVTVIAMVVAVPVGLAAAVYLSEYAGRRSRKVLKPVLEVLAGLPSVVIGFFALSWISPQVVQRLFTDANGLNMMAAGIGVGIMTIPIVASISEDSLTAVPPALREASFGLGARRLSTTLRVVVPAAISGLVASIIVAMSRAIGETMVVAIAMGASGGALFSVDPTQNGQTMTGAMISLATGSDQAVGSDAAFLSLFFVGLLLFLVTFALNLLGERFVRRVQNRY